jgi:hypothetical protein
MRFQRVGRPEQAVFAAHHRDPFGEEARRGRARHLFFLMMSASASPPRVLLCWAAAG